MIRSRRRAHAGAAVALAGGLAVLLATGLAWRPELPPVSSEELRLLRQAGFAGPVSPRARTFERSDGDLAFTLEVEETADGGLRLALQPRRPILRPDLLVYWVPAAAERPGDDAVLLGSLAGASRRRLVLPPTLREAGGELLVYSLPHQLAVAHLSLSPGVAAP